MNEATILRHIADTLGVDAADLSVESTADDFPEWDSMAVLSLMTLLAREGLAFDPGETRRLRSVRGIVQLFREAGKLQ